MNKRDMILALDSIEAEMRSLESRVNTVRAALREEIDPLKKRRDLGYWPDEDGDGLRPRTL